MLNRAKAPDIQEIRILDLPEPKKYFLDNGIPVYAINMGTQDVLKLEVVFYAGRPFEEKKLASRATAGLLKEGTKKYSASQIAETIDFYGGTLSTPVNLDTSNIQLYTLAKHFDSLLPVVAEMLSQPLFPEEELQSFKNRNVQRLQIDLTKNDVVAYRTVTEKIFGKDVPYGYNSFKETYQALEREDLRKHFSKNYNAGNCQIFLSGKITEKHIKTLNKHLGQVIAEGKQNELNYTASISTPQKLKIEHPDTIQTAIRIGRKLFNKKHEDFKGFYILSTILGGYFGSRLMTNIREDKGYTYNIFSTVDSMLMDGCFYIGTEVGNEFAEKTLAEIYREFEILQNELIGDSELEMVRNYLLGNLLTMLDGAFNVSEVIKAHILEDLPLSEFSELVQVIKTTSPQEIQRLAQKYLNKKDMWEVQVGA